LASRILTEYKQAIQGFTLIPASGGCFELSLDGELVYSKLKTGEFPDETRIIGLVGKRMGLKV
jgi:selenoprotein W-related protein